MSHGKKVLTGITTSGVPHIGNLVGAILPAIESSREDEVSPFLFLADYHSLIKNHEPDLTYESSFEVAAAWLACGLDPERVTFYRQSDVPHIMELAWILSCVTAKGLLNRAHAYKASVAENEEQKSKDSDRGITMGLFNYPILMSADILAFNADDVPVGQDQKQHLEMTRDIANRFNHIYGQVFTVPEAVISEESGILPGIDGRKMSKSYGNTIPIFCERKRLEKLIKKIKTNSLEPGEPKDTSDSTIFSLYKAFSPKGAVLEMEKKYEAGISWGEAKAQLIEVIDERVSPFRAEYLRVCEDRAHVEQTLKEGAEKAMDVSAPLLDKVRKLVGIKRF